MKRLFTSLLILFVGASVQAQDIIVKNDGDEIEAEVQEITVEDIIKYKEYDHLDGPIRNIRAKEVFMIIYENGEREIFKDEDSSETDSNAEKYTESDTKSQETDETESEDEDVTNQDVESNNKEASGKSREDKSESNSESTVEEDVQSNPTESATNENEYFSIGVGRGTTYGLQGVNIGYRFGTIEIHGGIGGYISGGEISSFSVGTRIYTDKHLFFDIQIFNSSILSSYNIQLSGTTVQAGGDIPLGDVVALSGTGGIAYFFDLGGTAFTWNGGIKFRF